MWSDPSVRDALIDTLADLGGIVSLIVLGWLALAGADLADDAIGLALYGEEVR